MGTIDWYNADLGTTGDFDESFKRDDSLDLTWLDFEHYIWIRFCEGNMLTIGDVDGFWKMCEEEKSYATPEDWLDYMVTGDMFCRIPRDAKGYQPVEPIWE